MRSQADLCEAAIERIVKETMDNMPDTIQGAARAVARLTAEFAGALGYRLGAEDGVQLAHEKQLQTLELLRGNGNAKPN